MMRRFLTWLSDHLPARAITHQGERYLDRYYIGTLFGYWRVYLHHFVGPDPDGLHSHPWKWGLSIVLAGWYLEQRRFGHRVVRWINIVNGDTFHRVIVPVNSTTWSLFIHSPRVMNWGFLREHVQFSFGCRPGKIRRNASWRYEEFGDADLAAHSDWWRRAPRGRDLRQAREVMPAVFRRRSRSDA